MILKMAKLPLKGVAMPFFYLMDKTHIPLNCSEGTSLSDRSPKQRTHEMRSSEAP